MQRKNAEEPHFDWSTENLVWFLDVAIIGLQLSRFYRCAHNVGMKSNLKVNCDTISNLRTLFEFGYIISIANSKRFETRRSAKFACSKHIGYSTLSPCHTFHTTSFIFGYFLSSSEKVHSTCHSK